jgi:hypothetical protein
VSVKDTLLALAGPLFMTVIAYVRVTPSPAVTVVTPSLFVIARSAFAATVVVAVALLFPVVVSLGDDTVAVLVRVCGVLGAVTVIVIAAVAPAASVARVHVTVAVPEQLQPVPFAETNVVVGGRVSETLTEFASVTALLFVTLTV